MNPTCWDNLICNSWRYRSPHDRLNQRCLLLHPRLSRLECFVTHRCQPSSGVIPYGRLTRPLPPSVASLLVQHLLDPRPREEAIVITRASHSCRASPLSSSSCDDRCFCVAGDDVQPDVTASPGPCSSDALLGTVAAAGSEGRCCAPTSQGCSRRSPTFPSSSWPPEGLGRAHCQTQAKTTSS